MRIENSIDPLKPDPTGSTTKRPGGVAGGPIPTVPASDDKVALSETSRKLANARSDTNEVRVEKVDAVRAAIESGQFRVDAQKVADKLIVEAAQLLETIVVDRPA